MAGIFKGKAAALKVCGIELNANAKFGAHSAPYCVHDCEQKACPVFQTAAPFILAFIAKRREKLADQIAMGSVNLHTVKARFFSQLRGFSKALDNPLNLLRRQRANGRKHGRKLSQIERNIR